MLRNPNGAAAGPRTPRLANAPAGTNRGALTQCLSPKLALSGRSAAFAGMSVQLGRSGRKRTRPECSRTIYRDLEGSEFLTVPQPISHAVTVATELMRNADQRGEVGQCASKTVWASCSWNCYSRGFDPALGRLLRRVL